MLTFLIFFIFFSFSHSFILIMPLHFRLHWFFYKIDVILTMLKIYFLVVQIRTNVEWLHSISTAFQFHPKSLPSALTTSPYNPRCPQNPFSISFPNLITPPPYMITKFYTYHFGTYKCNYFMSPLFRSLFLPFLS